MRTRVFVYEFTCAQPASSSASQGSLAAEGLAMLRAVLEDFSRLPGVDLLTIARPELAATLAAIPQSTIISNDDRESFCRLAQAADGTLIIAPEFDNILLTRCRCVEEAG